MNITEQVARCAGRGVNLQVRTRGICPWACVAVTLERDDYGITLLFPTQDIHEAFIDTVGMRIDHALQDYFSATRAR